MTAIRHVASSGGKVTSALCKTVKALFSTCPPDYHRFFAVCAVNIYNPIIMLQSIWNANTANSSQKTFWLHSMGIKCNFAEGHKIHHDELVLMAWPKPLIFQSITFWRNVLCYISTTQTWLRLPDRNENQKGNINILGG